MLTNAALVWNRESKTEQKKNKLSIFLTMYIPQIKDCNRSFDCITTKWYGYFSSSLLICAGIETTLTSAMSQKGHNAITYFRKAKD